MASLLSERGAARLAHLSGGQGVGGSNPLAPTIFLQITSMGSAASRVPGALCYADNLYQNYTKVTLFWIVLALDVAP